jgi:hypothetical protein
MKKLPVLLLALAAACNDTPDVNLGGNYKVAMAMPPIANRDIDILFVVDNSLSMQDNQQQVAAKAKNALFDIIAAAVGGPPNLHVGVISSDMGAGGFPIGGCDSPDDGRLLATPVVQGCTAPSGTFLIDVEAPGGGREQNFTGTLGEAFGCIVQLDGNGCGFEQHFAAVEKAVSGTVPENAGFLRDEALLVVIFLSDEDDCSATDPALFDPNDMTLGPFSSFRCFQNAVVCDPDDPATPGDKTGCHARAGSPYVRELPDVVDSLVAAKGGDPTKVLVATIAGETGPVSVTADDFGPKLAEVCAGDPAQGGGAYPAIRLFEILESFPGRSWFESICEPDMEPALKRTANAIGDVAGRRPCLHGNLKDVDPVADGIQPSCRAFAVERPFTADETRRELKACADAKSDQACFTVSPDSGVCGYAAPALRADVDARGDTTLGGKHIVVECLEP